MLWHRIDNREIRSSELNTLLENKDFGDSGYVVLSRIRSFVSEEQKDNSNHPVLASIKEWSNVARKTKKKLLFLIEKMQEIGLISYKIENGMIELSTVQKVILKCDTDRTRNTRQATFREKHKEFSSKNKSKLKDEKVTVVTPTDTESDTDSENICINTNTDTKKEEPVCNVSVSLPNSCLSREALKAEAVNQVMNHEQFKSLDESHRDVYVESMVKFMETSTKDTLLGKTNSLKSILNSRPWGLSKEFSARLVSNNPKVQPKAMDPRSIEVVSRDSDRLPLDEQIKSAEFCYKNASIIGSSGGKLAETALRRLNELLARKAEIEKQASA